MLKENQTDSPKDLKPLLPLPFLFGRSRLTPTLRRWCAIPSGRVIRSQHGTRLRLENDGMYEGLYYFGEYEPWQTRIFRAIVRHGDTCFDVGANFGWYTTLFAEWVGNGGSVHAFEPVPEIFAKTSDAIRLNHQEGRVHLNNFGLGDESGTFNVFRFAGLSHGHASAFDLGRDDAVPVKCAIKTLDQYKEDAGVASINFIKMDVEGYEREVILGAKQSLGGPLGPVVSFEVNAECLANRRLPAVEVQNLLRRSDYRHFWRVGPGREIMKLPGDILDGVDGDYLAAKDCDCERIRKALSSVKN